MADMDATCHGRTLKVLAIETTLRCDQGCVFCGSRAGDLPPGELSFAELVGVIDQASRMGATCVEFTGGEPVMRTDWAELVQAASSRGMETTLITAGGPISADVARRAVAAGLSRFGVSIDGPPEIHDRYRRVQGSYERALRAMSTLREAGIPIACNTHVNAQNWRALPQLADVLVGLGLCDWQIQLMIPMGRAAQAQSLWLQPFDVLDVIPMIASLVEECASRGLEVTASDNVGYFGPHEHTLRRRMSKYGHTIGCGAGVSMISIDTAGNATGCAALDAGEVCAGNVRTHALRELWDNAPELRIGLSRSHVHGYCAECYYSRICRGGCTGVAIGLTGQRGDNPYCHHRALEFARRGLRERLVLRGVETRGRRGHNLFDIQVEPMPAD
jgi:radical SAM protein with 4Fe4S-binding SPASM domain